MATASASRPRSGVRAFSRPLLLLAVVVVVAALGALAATRFTTASGPALKIDAPATARVGEPFAVTLTVTNANGIGGYETKLAFDTSAVQLRGFEQRPQDLRKLGRDAAPLGPVEHADGVSIGAYSCPVADCGSPTGAARTDKGAFGTLRLSTVSFVANRAGKWTVTLVDPVFVDASGQRVDVQASRLRFTVDVRE